MRLKDADALRPVLVVARDADHRELWLRILRLRGYEPHGVADHAAALFAAAKHAPRVALVDATDALSAEDLAVALRERMPRECLLVALYWDDVPHGFDVSFRKLGRSTDIERCIDAWWRTHRAN